MTKMREHCWTMILAVALCVPAAWTQQKDPRTNPPLAPLPPLAPGESSSKPPEGGSATAMPEPKPMTPDTRPLSGVEEFTLGSVGGARSYLEPRFHLTQLVDTTGGSTSGQTKLGGVTLLRGEIALQRIWSHYQLTTRYLAGGSLYNNHGGLNSPFHQFGITQTIAWRRWLLLLGDDLGYLPESSFGFQGFAGLGQFYGGTGGQLVPNTANLNPLLVPNQSILTGRAPRINNTFVGQANYQLTPRASFTASGSYGMLRILGPGFIDSNNTTFRAGYNYAVTSRDTLAVIYGVNWLRFDANNSGLNNQIFHLAYGRRVTGRLALQIAGGAQMNTFRNPVQGAGRELSWSLHSSLRYHFRNSDLDLSYLRHTTGGSGVLLGAQSHLIDLTVNRQFSRRWSALVDLGYAHNTSLRQLTTGLNDHRFDSWRTGVHLSRPVGRYWNVFFLYYVQQQNTNATFCAASSCGQNSLRHHFGFGFDWHFRPIEID